MKIGTTTTTVLATLAIGLSALTAAPCSAQEPSTITAGYSIPTLDLSKQLHRQFLVDHEAGQYLGHPTTVLLEDGKTILCVYPKDTVEALSS